MTGERGLDARNLSKRFGGYQAVADVSLSLRPGECVALLGPNGAGKSTVFNMLTGVLKPDTGQIRVDGIDLGGLPVFARALCGLGYLPQEPSAFRGLTVEDNILLALETLEPDRDARRHRLEEVLESTGLGALRGQIASRLSGGERRRCEIARMLAGRPGYVLLDEPFAAIDPLAIGAVKDLIRSFCARGLGVLLSDHNVRDTLAVTDRAIVIAHGHVIAAGTPAEIVADPGVRGLWLGQDFHA